MFGRNGHFGRNGYYGRNGQTWPYMAIHGHAWPCMAIYGRVWPCMAISTKMAISTIIGNSTIIAFSTKSLQNRCRFIRSIRDSLPYSPLASMSPETYQNSLFFSLEVPRRESRSEINLERPWVHTSICPYSSVHALQCMCSQVHTPQSIPS